MQLNFEKMVLEKSGMENKDNIDPHLIPPSLRGEQLPREINHKEYLEMQKELMLSSENIQEAKEVLGHEPTEKEASNYWVEHYAEKFAEAWRSKLESETWH